MIGFKTEYMKRAEVEAKVEGAMMEGLRIKDHAPNLEVSGPGAEVDELLVAMMRQRIGRQAMELLDKYLFGPNLPDYTFAELRKLKKLVLTVEQ